MSGNTADIMEKAKIRRVKAHELRVLGWSFPEIGRELGVSTSQAYNDVQKFWKETYEPIKEEIDQSRNRMLLRLDMLAKQMLAKYNAGGKDADLQAALLLKVMEREAKLLGVDAPVKAEVTTFQAQISEALGRITADGGCQRINK